MDPSPVMKICTAVVVEPSGSDEGGNTKTALSTFWRTGSSEGEAKSSAPPMSAGEGCDGIAENDIGLSIMAMHLTTDEYRCIPSDGADWGMCLAIGKS
jgi:hypothetical protein